MSVPVPAGDVVRDALGLLAFRTPSKALARRPGVALVFGLACTWLAGIGRYWDHPSAHAWQYAGLGSVAYVFVLALVLWLLIWPLRPARWTYGNVLRFVALTSPPALLYAIPVERVLPMPVAQSVNAWFLAIVATWRVALLVWFLYRVARLDAGAVVVATLLPLALIVASLAALNLEHAVFELMAGNEPSKTTANDAAYGIVWLLTALSLVISPILILAYVVQIVSAWEGERIGD